MSRYRPYPAYKDSGVEWLGEMPEHWDVMPLKRSLKLLTEKTSRRDFPVALENIEGWSGRFLETESEFEGEGVLFEAGDILFGKLRPYLAKVYLAEVSGEAVGDFHVLRPARSINSRFVQYQILNRDFISIADSSTFGAKMPRVSWEFMGNMEFLVPPIAEQTAISTFVDHETAKLDTLIAKQEKLIELLQEKRQALISHAVTKGLNPDATMKDSGVEWLGEMPGHWHTIPVKRVVGTIEQGWSPQCEGFPVQGSDEWGVLKVGCVNGGIFNPGENKKLPSGTEAQPNLGIISGDVLISRANTRELVGSAAVVRASYPNLMLCDKLYRIRLITKCLPEYFAWFLGIRAVRWHIELAATGASNSMLNISQSTILELGIPLPPIEEQLAISRHIGEKTTKLDTVIEKSRRFIDLLREHRTALISAAVTGRIDVRGIQ